MAKPNSEFSHVAAKYQSRREEKNAKRKAERRELRANLVVPERAPKKKRSFWSKLFGGR